jgi:hypothetical protein
MPALPVQRNKNLKWILLALVLLGGLVALTIVLVTGKKNSSGDGQTAKAGAPGDDDKSDKGDKGDKPGTAAQPAVDIDPESGFDVIVDPIKAHVKLDDKTIGDAPLSVRNLATGVHTLTVELDGYKPHTEQVAVEKGKAKKINIKLDATTLTASFVSTPPGAKVTLVSPDGSKETGTTPTDWKVDPGKQYQAVFEKDGYATAQKDFDPAVESQAAGGGPTFTVAVVMDKAQMANNPTPQQPVQKIVRQNPIHHDPVQPKDPVQKDPTPVKDPPVEAAGTGFLSIGAKPQCKIFIDGKDTGLSTPQRGYEVKSGPHRVTLVNNEFNIKESVAVDVKPGETAKVIKDFSDRLPQ